MRTMGTGTFFDRASRRRTRGSPARKVPVPIFLLLCGLALAAEPVETGLPRVRALLDADRWKDALEHALSMVEGTETSAEADAALGEALWRAGRLKEAAEALARASEAEGADGRTLAALAIARSARGDDREAAALLDRALERSPDDPYVLYRAAGGSPDRATAIARLTRYLEVGKDEDEEKRTGATNTIALYRQLGERPLWVVKERPARLEIPLRGIGAGGGRANGWVANARMENGKTIRLLLDTGAWGLTAVSRMLEKGNFEPLAEDTLFAGGGKEPATATRGILPELAFEGLVFGDVLASATARELHPRGDFHGVLGLGVFSGYRATLDLAKGRLLLERGGDPPRGGSPYWIVSGQMLVEAGPEGGEKALMVLDTGAERSVLSKEFARSLDGATVGGSASVRGFSGRFPDAEIVRGVRLAFSGMKDGGGVKSAIDLSQRSRISGVEVSGLLGMDLLDGAHLVIDPSTHTVGATLPPRK